MKKNHFSSENRCKKKNVMKITYSPYVELGLCHSVPKAFGNGISIC